MLKSNISLTFYLLLDDNRIVKFSDSAWMHWRKEVVRKDEYQTVLGKPYAELSKEGGKIK